MPNGRDTIRLQHILGEQRSCACTPGLMARMQERDAHRSSNKLVGDIGAVGDLVTSDDLCVDDICQIE